MGQLAGNHFLSVVEGAEQLHEMGRTVLSGPAADVTLDDIQHAYFGRRSA